MVYYELVQTTDEHIAELAETMSQADRDEIWASNHLTPMGALMLSKSTGAEMTTGLADGEVGCIQGVVSVSMLSGTGTPWMLGSDVVAKHARVFLRGSRVWLENEQERWQSLSNYVDVRHTRAVRWLKWLGFEFDEAAPHGMDGLPFHRFSWEKE